jgi:hypothetical protein
MWSKQVCRLAHTHTHTLPDKMEHVSFMTELQKYYTKMVLNQYKDDMTEQPQCQIQAL